MSLQLSTATAWRRLGAAASLASLACLAATASAATLSNDYALLTINELGTLGDGSQLPGFMYDVSGNANFKVMDLVAPGIPFEGFYISSTQGAWFSNNADGSTFINTALSSVSATQARWSGTTYDGTLQVVNDYSLSLMGDQPRLTIQTSITNTGSERLTEAAFLRTVDPDPDVLQYVEAATLNRMVNGATCASGPISGATLCLQDLGSAYAHAAGDSTTWSEQPQTFLLGSHDGDGDNTLGLAYDLGNLEAGSTAQLTYAYTLSPSLASAVPEPPVSMLMLLGAGVLFMGRRCRALRPR